MPILNFLMKPNWKTSSKPYHGLNQMGSTSTFLMMKNAKSTNNA